MTILLLCNYHTAMIRWTPLTVQIFRSVLFKKKPLILLWNVCLEFSWCWVLINRHLQDVNETSCSSGMSVAQRVNDVYRWSFGWEFESWFEHCEQAEHVATHLRNTTLNNTWNSSGNHHSGSLVPRIGLRRHSMALRGTSSSTIFLS